MKKSKKSMKGGNPTCSGAMLGGKRRSRSRRTIKGGAAGVGPPITVGTLENVYVDTGASYNSATGDPMPDIYNIKLGGRRRRGSRKTRKGGKHRRGTRKMKGGYTPGMMSAGQVGYGFSDTSLVGSGPPNATGYVQSGNRI